jgi:hypothetical protein
VQEWWGGRGRVLKTQGLANEKRGLYGLRGVQVTKAALPLGHRCLWVPLPLGAATTRGLVAASWRRYHGELIFSPLLGETIACVYWRVALG